MTTKTTGASRCTKHTKHEYNPAETNWAALSFPIDAYGMTAGLRREFRAAVQRCHGSDEKFRHLLDNLEVLTAWAAAKLEDDKATNARNAAAAAAAGAEAARREEFRQRIQAGLPIKVTATDTGFMEISPRNGSVLAVYPTAGDPRGPVAAMAQMMLDEGRDPNSPLDIHAFGRPGIGSGQTLQQLAATAHQIASEATTAPAPGGLQATQQYRAPQPAPQQKAKGITSAEYVAALEALHGPGNRLSFDARGRREAELREARRIGRENGLK